MFRFNLWARPFLPPTTQNMEGNPFFPTSMGIPPTLAYGTLPDGKNGMHVTEKDKDTAVPYSGAFPLLRPGDSLPHALYSPIHQQFLRAQLELANAHAREADVHPAHAFSHSSAFAPAKKTRLEERLERSSVSPVGSPTHPQNKLEEPQSPESHVSRGSSSSPMEVIDGRRSSGLSEGRTTPPEDGHCCPICRCHLPSQEVTSHLAKEMHELKTLMRLSKRHSSEDRVMPSRSRYETFIRIRGNRESRLAKLRGLRRKRPQEDDSSFLSGSHDDSFRRDEEEQIDVLNCDDTDRDVSRHLQISDKPRDFSRKSSSPVTLDNSSTRLSQESLCCSGCACSFTKVVPMTSTKCWHLRCENCWSMSQDHCPQCHIPLCVDDLRKILI